MIESQIERRLGNLQAQQAKVDQSLNPDARALQAIQTTFEGIYQKSLPPLVRETRPAPVKERPAAQEILSPVDQYELPDGRVIKGFRARISQRLDGVLQGAKTDVLCTGVYGEDNEQNRSKIFRTISSFNATVLTDYGRRIVSRSPKGKGAARQGKVGTYVFGEVEMTQKEKEHWVKIRMGQSRTIEVGGKKIRLTEKERKIWRVLVAHVGESIKSGKLAHEAKLGVQRGLGTTFKSLAKMINKAAGREILSYEGDTLARTYQLKDALVVWKLKGEEAQERKARKDAPLGASRLATINLLAENPEAQAGEIIESLGMTARGRKHTWIQASRSIANSINRLYQRDRQRVLAPEEAETLKKVREHIAAKKMRNLGGFIREAYTRLRPVHAESTAAFVEPINNKLIDESDAVVLAYSIGKALTEREDFAQKYVTDGDPEDLAIELIEQLPPLTIEGASGEEMLRQEAAALERVHEQIREIISGGKLDHLDEAYDPKLQRLFIYLAMIEGDKTLELIEDLRESVEEKLPSQS